MYLRPGRMSSVTEHGPQDVRHSATAPQRSQSCPVRPRLSAPRRICAPAKSHRRLQVNSCVRRWSTFAKANTALAPASKPSRSAYPKLVVPVCRCRHPKKVAPRDGLAKARNAIWPPARGAASPEPRQHDADALRRRHCVTSRDQPLPIAPCRGKRNRQPGVAVVRRLRRALGSAPLAKRYSVTTEDVATDGNVRATRPIQSFRAPVRRSFSGVMPKRTMMRSFEGTMSVY